MFGMHISWEDSQRLVGMHVGVAVHVCRVEWSLRFVHHACDAKTAKPIFRKNLFFERIPFFRQQLATRARALVLAAAEKSDVLANFLRQSISSFYRAT